MFRSRAAVGVASRLTYRTPTAANLQLSRRSLTTPSLFNFGTKLTGSFTTNNLALSIALRASPYAIEHTQPHLKKSHALQHHRKFARNRSGLPYPDKEETRNRREHFNAVANQAVASLLAQFPDAPDAEIRKVARQSAAQAGAEPDEAWEAAEHAVESGGEGISLGKAAGGVVTGGVVLAKAGGWAMAGLKMLKLTKFASLGSMMLSVGAYSMFFGVPYAVGMVGLLLVHEAGHALVMKQQGLPFGPMVFLPFMGAVVEMKDQPKDAYSEALVALGGPYLGSVGAVTVAAAGWMLDNQLLMALGDFGFMINLFNLLPMGSLDGGRIAGAISKWALLVGLGAGGGLIWFGLIWNPIFYLIYLAACYSTYQRFFPGGGELPPSYYRISWQQRLGISGAYFGLIVALLVAMQSLARRKKSPKQLKEEAGQEPSEYDLLSDTDVEALQADGDFSALFDPDTFAEDEEEGFDDPWARRGPPPPPGSREA